MRRRLEAAYDSDIQNSPLPACISPGPPALAGGNGRRIHHPGRSGDGAWKLDPKLIPAGARVAGTTFQMRVPRSFVRRMRRGDPDDPLLRQVLPLHAELEESAPNYTADPVGERAALLSARASTKVPRPGFAHHDVGVCGSLSILLPPGISLRGTIRRILQVEPGARADSKRRLDRGNHSQRRRSPFAERPPPCKSHRRHRKDFTCAAASSPYTAASRVALPRRCGTDGVVARTQAADCFRAAHQSSERD